MLTNAYGTNSQNLQRGLPNAYVKNSSANKKISRFCGFLGP